VYSATFDAPASKEADMLLVFDSIKMAAGISLNGQKLGIAADQVIIHFPPCSVLF
jgi:hypothetical protein